jgi:hypothetical protein
MTGFLRLLLGLVLLPACWGMALAVYDSLMVTAGAGGFASAEVISLLGGILAFALSWAALTRPVRAYVLGHELTHAIWALLFGARVSDLKIGDGGGSVRVSKSNFVITLAPYFFPFYTFVVIVAALVSYAFFRPLPFLPLWMFMIGFTWAFHVLFTLETLSHRQPDIREYGRVFSWAVIFIVNVATVLVWLAATTPLEFARLGAILAERGIGAYMLTFSAFRKLWIWTAGLF